MRTIKFRAFHKDLKLMREVFSINFDHNEVTVGYPDSETLRGTLYEGEFELMQFTGLFDNNNKEVYEGDIIKGVPNFSERVAHKNPTFDAKEVYYASSGFHVSGTPFGIPIGHLLCMEVIGNIYENIELLHENPELLDTK